MNYTRILGGFLLAAPLAGFAQATSPIPPRYYVGLAAYTSSYQPLGGNYFSGTRIPLQLTAGYQLRPRLAVQVGVAYSGLSYSYFNAGRYYTTSGAAASPYAYYEFQGRNQERNTSVALLARYTLTRKPQHRFQADLLGGFTLERERFNRLSTQTYSDSTRANVITENSDDTFRRNNLLLTGGASARYRFGRHLEAVLDFTISQSLTDSRNTYSRLTSATALGLRYRFGRS
ncbi:MAG TPA: outer membrane beta-barrel protein [Hymenobacter sp.]|uniref:outer membrane beta-barrel protein n=1 Tax=Hymenobacter sp. TaxID=1898978 RepID=UPI002D80BEC7|nr:outer membrane beta-barrel protein [Hymenobacter sp.]HET9502882.1 outer membrane beta-barrel protein [Hymenobacter sp.]